MWEYSDSENRFGTPEALMLLPYWTGGCIDSMEGLLFESSTTTPYHFLNQAELSAGPSDPEVGLPYGSLDVTLGVQHLQLLGVRYFIAETPTVEQEADADPALKLVATSRTVDLRLQRHPDAHHVERLPRRRLAAGHAAAQRARGADRREPPRPSSWLGPSGRPGTTDPSRWDVELAQSGPPRGRAPRCTCPPAVRPVPTTEVTGITRPTPPSAFTSRGWAPRSW